MLKRFYSRLTSWFKRVLLGDSRPVHLAIVRRYTDANHNYIGELYLYEVQGGVAAYRMIGASLDSLPFSSGKMEPGMLSFVLDPARDFLAPMPPNTIRVGALEPKDNDNVRRMIASLGIREIKLVIQNGFIEHVLGSNVVNDKGLNQ